MQFVCHSCHVLLFEYHIVVISEECVIKCVCVCVLLTCGALPSFLEVSFHEINVTFATILSHSICTQLYHAIKLLHATARFSSNKLQKLMWFLCHFFSFYCSLLQTGCVHIFTLLHHSSDRRLSMKSMHFSCAVELPD